jgi:ankyrin repeat and SOCS box protein 7
MDSGLENAFSAIANSDVARLTSIFEQGDAVSLSMSTDEEEFTLLHYTAARGDVACAEFLLGHQSTKINALTKYHSTPLHLAAFHGYSKLIQVLLNHEGEEVADVLMRDEEGHTPLCIARMFKHSSAVKTLVSACIERYYLTTPNTPSYVRCSR